MNTIKNSGREVVVEPYFFRPWILCVGDLDEDSSYEQNFAMPEWYGKESISCQLSDSE